ncbi:MAG: ATP-binding protein, partial [Gammaproteobacteria bacterium]|nr:ATP-binding protein [Gammaproteobacteria bacterium]
MKIKQITIKNVKSFKNEAIIDFDDELNILIGPNSGGKSNLLSIITIVMNHYFYDQYQFQFESKEGGKIYEKGQAQARFGNINLELDKYFGDSSESKIKIKLMSDTTDYENMKCISDHKDVIAQRQQMYNSSVKLDSPDDWENMFSEPKELIYEINNCSFVQPEGNSHEHIFLYYLKNYNTYRWYSDEMEALNLFTPMLFFPPSRSLNGQFKIDQSSIKTTDYFNNINSVSSIHSRAQNASLSQIAIMHFGRLYKRYTWKAANTRDNKTVDDLFNEDNEVKQLTKYLGKIGYSWRLKEDRPLNQYTFVL